MRLVWTVWVGVGVVSEVPCCCCCFGEEEDEDEEGEEEAELAPPRGSWILRLSRANRDFVVSQQPGSGRFVSQHHWFVPQSRRASLPPAVLTGRSGAPRQRVTSRRGHQE